MFGRMVSYAAAYTHASPGRDHETAVALDWLSGQQTSDGAQLLVLAPSKQALDESPVIRQIRSSLLLFSVKTFKAAPGAWSGGPALALWPTTAMVELLDQHHGTRALAVVPWQLDEIDVWIRARRPADLLGIAPQADAPQISDPVVRVALEGMTNGINLGTGLSHPSDKARAVQTFRVLRAGGHRWATAEVQAWALAHGWTASGAADLARYADGIAAGRSFRTSREVLRRDILDVWRADVRNAR